MKKLNLLLVFFVFINLNTFAQIFTKITEGPLVNDKSDGIGCTWGDYDNDGDLDVFIAVSQPSLNNPNRRNFLYQNNCNGQFTKIIAIPGDMVTDEEISNTATWVDYDNDDDLDLFVTNQPGKNSLYRNNGDGTFSKIINNAIVNDITPARGCGWADYDNDGDIDLAISHIGNNLYNNSGDGTFTKITTGDIASFSGFSLSTAWADFDNDGDMDLFIANGIIKRLFYRNNGDGTFSLITTIPIITDQSSFILGCTWADYDNDLDLDLFLTTGLGNRKNFLYRNNNDGTFTQITNGPLVNDLSDTQGSSLWGDYDNDGDLDVFVTNIGQNFLYQNNGNGTFSRITNEIVETDIIVESWSAVWVDFDNDGDLDLFVPNAFGSPNNFLYLNNGNANHWIDIKCVGTISNRSAVGARVFAKANINGFDTWQMREININANGFFSGGIPPLNVHLGFGDATIIDSLRIVWPTSGITQIFTNVAVDQFIEITEGINAIAIAEPCVPDLPVEDPGFVIGTVFNDVDSNCIFDPLIDFPISNRIVEARPGPNFVFSDNSGNYEFRLPEDSYNIKQAVTQNDIWNLQDCQDSILPVNVVPVSTISDKDFANQPALFAAVCGVTTTIVSTPFQQGSCPSGLQLISPCPGFLHKYCIDVTNTGTSPLLPGSELQVVLDPFMTFSIVSLDGCGFGPPTVDITGTILTWSFPQIGAGVTCTICIDVNVNGVSFPFSSGATANVNCVGNTTGTDSDSETDPIECSCDPNDKLISPKGCGPFGSIGRDEILVYKVRFQNTGTGPANDIIIRDELDSNLDISSLKITASSDPITRVEIIPDNALIITFENINLPDSASDPAGSQGFVVFSIKPKDGLPDGTIITNQAGIYFDRNDVVLTNTTLNTIRDNPFPIADFEANHSLTSTDLVYDFTYTGGTSDNAFFEWDFGPDAAPSISTDENPSDIEFNSTGFKQITLTITRFGCTSSIAKTVEVVDVHCGKNNDKILICHIPPGNPGNSQTICISPNSLSDHLAHGDGIGPCPPSNARKARDKEDKSITNAHKSQNIFEVYPNPFSQTTTFYFTIPETGYVKLELFNNIGQKVVTLYNTYAEAQKEYSLQFNSQNLPEGIYLGMLQTGNERKIIKIVVLK